MGTPVVTKKYKVVSCSRTRVSMHCSRGMMDLVFAMRAQKALPYLP